MIDRYLELIFDEVDSSFDLSLTEDSTEIGVSFGDVQEIYIHDDRYEGSYEVTPSRETQTLLTSGLLMSQDVIVNPIPPQYGLITYNGSTITVS